MAGPKHRRKLQPRSMQANINSFNNQIRRDPDSIYRTRSPAGNQYETRRFNVVDSNTTLGTRYKGGSNQEDVLKSGYFSNSYFTNPTTGNKFGNSIATFQGPDREWGESRHIYPDASGYGQTWDSEGNESYYPIQLKGPQTWNYDPGSTWTGFNNGGTVNESQRKRQWDAPLARIENPRSNALDNYYGWNSSMGRDVRNDPSLPPQFQYRDQGRTVVSGNEPAFTDMGRNRNVPFPQSTGTPNFRPPYGAPGQPSYNEWQQMIAPDQSGIMGLEMADATNYMNKMKEGYKKIDPYLPDVDWQNKSIGHEWNKPLWGGNLGIGGEYDVDDDEYNVGINWGTAFG